MIEVVVLICICGSISEMAQAKGLQPYKYQAMLVLFWFLGEFVVGALACITVVCLAEDSFDISNYMILIWLTAIFGAKLAFMVIDTMKAHGSYETS
ncbi:hypothetical protein BH11PLA2_BH11PLA2_26060 [soil metagenome]